MPQIGPLEILVIFIVALVVFGPSKLPQIGRQVGRGVREFRKFQSSLRDDIEEAFRDEDDGADDVEDVEDVEDVRVEGDQPKSVEAGKPDPAPAPTTPDPTASDPSKPSEPPPAATAS